MVWVVLIVCRVSGGVLVLFVDSEGGQNKNWSRLEVRIEFNFTVSRFDNGASPYDQTRLAAE
jgi:hypothetical protein